MELNDKRIAHLKNLGGTREVAIGILEEELKRNSDFLEIAEITDVLNHRDGGTPNKRVGYVAGICGSKEAKNEYDLGDDIYRLIYFNGMVQEENFWKHGGGTIHSPNIQQITDYVILKAKKY